MPAELATPMKILVSAAIAGAIGRTASPIAGVTIVCAGLAYGKPSRNGKAYTAPGMILARLS